jgi:hypothetical protein
MTSYIKISTGEYPRHPGDIALDPDSEYAVVGWVDKPSFDGKTQRCYEGPPVNEDGTWRMTWIVREATQEEIDAASKPFDPFKPLGGRI